MRRSEVLQRVRFVPILLHLVGCAAGASNAHSGSGPQECSARLAPRQGAAAPRPLAPPLRPSPQSRIVVNAEMPLAPLIQTLEARIPKRLGEGQVRIGPGGRVSYSVNRGALSVSVSRTALLIETPVLARAEACRGDNCYASCEPTALVRAEVPLMLRPDYGFGRAAVSLRFTRGCKVRALGGLLTLDVTPTLEAQLAPELGKVAREIDGHLPDVRTEVERAWRELSKPRELPFGGCFVLQPFGIVQGPMSGSTQLLGARFALLAMPELRSDCGETPTPTPLPPLQGDPALPEEGVLQLAMVTPLTSLARAFEAATAITSEQRHLHVAHADVTAQGSDVDGELALAGDVCGSVALGAHVDFRGDGQFIGLGHAQLAEGERARLKDAGLEPEALVQALAAAPRITPLLSVRGFRDSAPQLAAGLSQPSLDVSATVSSARAAGAVARGDDLVAWLEARGAVRLSQKRQ